MEGNPVSTFLMVLLIVVAVLAGIFIALYFLGKRVEKKQQAQQEQMDAVAQTVSLLVIDKKKMRLKNAGLPAVVMSVRIRGVFSAEKLRRTLNLLLESDPALRTRIFFDENNEPVQYEAPYHAENFPVLDFENRSSADISQWEQSVAAAPMNLPGAPLYEFAIVRVNGLEGNVLVKLHHLIADGWSMLSLVNRMAHFYDTLIHNGEPETELLPSYRTHGRGERRERKIKRGGRYLLRTFYFRFHGQTQRRCAAPQRLFQLHSRAAAAVDRRSRAHFVRD